MNESNINEFRIIDKLGEGSFADVYKVKSIKDQKIYAEKRLKKRYRSLEEVRNLTEVSALRLLSRHPNIITLHSIMYDSQTGHVALIFEQMEMNLYDFIMRKKEVEKSQCDEYTALLLMYQLTKAISYVHSCGIFHRDIKPENCLVNSDTLELKLADFGSVSPIANRTKFTEYVATRWYRAPECIITTGAYGPPVDIWAIGCVFYELLTNRPLFPGKHQLDQLNIIHSILGSPSHDYMSKYNKKNENENANENEIQSNKCNLRFAFPIQKQKQPFESLLPNTSPHIVDLIKKMITYDPDNRITAADSLSHPAFALFSALDKEWQKSQRSVSFAEYAISSRGRISALQSPQPPLSNILSSDADSANAQIDDSNNSSASLKQPPPLIGIKSGNTKTVQPGPPAAGPQMNTLEARRIAAQRIVDYHKRQMISKTRLQKKSLDNSPLIQSSSIGYISGLSQQKQRKQNNNQPAPKIQKPVIHFTSSVYQKPKPEMVQPRLPSINFKPLKRQ